MFLYRFIIHGESEDGERGFYATRHAFALSAGAAERTVKERIMRDLGDLKDPAMWGGDAPSMRVQSVRRCGWHEINSAPNKGFTFYTEPCAPSIKVSTP